MRVRGGLLGRAVRCRPSRRGYALAGVLAVAGIVAVVWAASAMFAFGGALADFPRVDVPGRAQMTLEAGEYVVHYESLGEDGVLALDVAVHPVGATAPVELRRPGGSMEYVVNGYAGVALWQFTLDEPGAHLFEVASHGGAGQLVVGSGLFGDLLGIVLGLLGGAAALLLALVAAVVTAVRRARGRSAHPLAV